MPALRNGLSALTFVWSLDQPTNSQALALKAGLSSTISGGTENRSAYSVADFLWLKGIEYRVASTAQHLMLTITAPDENILTALDYFEVLFHDASYSKDWYARELQQLGLRISSKTGRPEDVLNEIAYYLDYLPGGETQSAQDHRYRFGRPDQVIIRSDVSGIERRATRLIDTLPAAKRQTLSSVWKWITSYFEMDDQPYSLPTGTIHFHDTDATEMLVLLIKAKTFQDTAQLLGANLLVDYIGANQGSEMFQIIRQDMRAAYDPRSDFIIMGKNKAIMTLSATTKATNWPDVYQRIKDIYIATRAGNAEMAGLNLQHSTMDRGYAFDFFMDSEFGALHYLHEHPTGTDGTFNLSFFTALENVSPVKVKLNAHAFLPPWNDFLLILIGGGEPPNAELKSKGYCVLPKNTPLSYCLDSLTGAHS